MCLRMTFCAGAADLCQKVHVRVLCGHACVHVLWYVYNVLPLPIHQSHETTLGSRVTHLLRGSQLSA